MTDHSNLETRVTTFFDLLQDFNKFILSLNYKEINTTAAGFVMTLKLISNKVQ